MAMRAGRLRHRVDVLTFTGAQNTYGEVDKGDIVNWYPPTDTVWASIEPMSGTEGIEGGATEGSVTHKVTMRKRTLNTAQRLRFGTRIFEIVSVLDKDERGIQLEAMCRETV